MSALQTYPGTQLLQDRGGAVVHDDWDAWWVCSCGASGRRVTTVFRAEALFHHHYERVHASG